MPNTNFADTKDKIKNILAEIDEMHKRLNKLNEMVIDFTNAGIPEKQPDVNPFFQRPVFDKLDRAMIYGTFAQKLVSNPFYCSDVDSLFHHQKIVSPLHQKDDVGKFNSLQHEFVNSFPKELYNRNEYKPTFASLQAGVFIYLHLVERMFKIGSIWVKTKKNFNNEGSDIYQLCDFIKSSSALLSIDINSPFFTNVVELVCLKPDNTLIPAEVNITDVKFFYDKGIKTLNDLSSLEGKHLIVLRTGVSYIVDSDQYGKFIFI